MLIVSVRIQSLSSAENIEEGLINRARTITQKPEAGRSKQPPAKNKILMPRKSFCI